MENSAPVYTLSSACQDCYKCLRQCHVKAINVHDGRAEIDRDRCLSCGQCVSHCPRQAKRFRDDLSIVKSLLEAEEKVAISLAPSWKGATGFNQSSIISDLKALGIKIVGETAMGAESVTLSTAKLLSEAEPGLHISTCCTVVVDYIRLYKPKFIKSLMPLASPALTHARLLKDYYGPELKIVFAGPCVAKKTEADRHPELLAAALTFSELKRWLRESQFEGGVRLENEEATFKPAPSFEGALYPLPGGMIEGLRKAPLPDNILTTTITGLERLDQALDSIFETDNRQVVFLEAMACSGGCLTGPAISSERSEILAVSDILTNVKIRKSVWPSKLHTLGEASWAPSPRIEGGHPLEEIQSTLASLGKTLPEDELNCSGCGYASCRELAAAILDGAAEPQMCVSNMRRLAARKATALVKAMPSAMVMVDRDLNILEVNEAFIGMFVPSHAKDTIGGPEALVGTPVSQWLEFVGLIRKVLRTGNDIFIEHRLYKGQLYNLSVFSVDKYRVAGAVVTDMTSLREGRASLTRKVREGLDKNMATVQEIACLLGEHMVETESVLTSLAEDLEYADEHLQDNDDS